MYVLGISAYFHDSAACILKDDNIIAAAQEERFSRKKNDASFPVASIVYCLKACRIKLAQVDHIIFYEKPYLKFERLLETYLAFAPRGYISFTKAMLIWLKEKLFLKKNIIRQLSGLDKVWNGKNLIFAAHHQSHAASAFYPSPFLDAVVLTIDGVGEWTTTSVSIGKNNLITPVREIRFPHSIGLLYSAFTYYLGFKVNSDEYKVMGLAPYGSPKYLDLIFENILDLKEDGSYWLNMKYFNYCTGLTMTSDHFHRLFGELPRSPSSELTQFHMDIASSVQAATETVMLKLTRSLFKEFKTDNLCLAGGVALNCVANGKILKESGFKNIWVQPAAGDAGGALGAAYTAYYQISEDPRIVATNSDKMNNALLGPSYDNETIKKCLINAKVEFDEVYGEEYYSILAKHLAFGKVIGYFNGRMEFGPRALGSRSILGDPRNPEMQSILNQKIKFRESFRPFAPAVLEEHTPVYFEIDCASPYMLMVSAIRSEFRVTSDYSPDDLKGFEKLRIARSTIPAVTHVDYSARIQTVNKDKHPDFYKLIEAFFNITGVPMVINTSFNRMDEPIVNTPEEALACFFETGMDILVIGNFIIRK